LAENGMAYCVSGYRGAAAFAIPLDSQGDITDSDGVRWSHTDSTPYVPSPLLYGDQFYFTRANSGILTSLNRADGSVIFGPARISGVDNVYASPVAAAGRIYIVSREGTTVVLEHGPELKVLATNVLDEPVDASPALVGQHLFLRSTSHLYCIGP
jgi:outer membrane protein assembly factor BamB